MEKCWEKLKINNITLTIISKKHSLLGLYLITGSYFQGYLGKKDIASVTNIVASCMPPCCVELLPSPSSPKTKPFGKRLLYALPLKVGDHAYWV